MHDLPPSVTSTPADVRRPERGLRARRVVDQGDVPFDVDRVGQVTARAGREVALTGHPICGWLPRLRPLGSINAPCSRRARGCRGREPGWADEFAGKRAKLDGDFQRADSRQVDPSPRIALDDLRERVAAIWAAGPDAAASEEGNGANRA